MPRDGGEARAKILECAEELVRRKGANAVTVEAVAKAAGSAKGLVHYHFKTKKGLLSAVASRLSQYRIENWSAAFESESPNQAIDQSWKLLAEESGNGTLRGWLTLLGTKESLTDQVTNKALTQFRESVGNALLRMLEEDMGLRPTVPADEVGHLMVAVIDGIGVQLLGGTDPEELQGAYAAAWLGLLSLTEPRS
ncbi:MAG: TetR/AcrR family transcriptional regulator [Gemmatimonadales bacterium]